MSTRTADERGEGFAFFRWHSGKWPDWHNCEFSRGGICWIHWTRRTR